MKLKILVADDSKSVRLLLKTCFEELGHEVVGEAENGAEALLEYAKIKPDVISLDINMPLMNGIEAAKLIKKNFSDAKIVMTTGESNTETVKEAISAGASQYLLKPIKKNKVEEALEKISGNKKSTETTETIDDTTKEENVNNN